MVPGRYRCALILTLSFFLCVEASAETPEETIQKLQEQLNALTKQVQAKNIGPAEEEARYTSKITQISPARVVPAPRQEEIIVTRLYDLSDLFAIVPAYPARYESDLAPSDVKIFTNSIGDAVNSGAVGGGGMGGGGGFYNILPQPSAGGTLDGAKTSVNNLISAIQSTVSPDQWDKVGGESTIAQLGMALLITTNEPTHEQITALLGQFRKRWGTLRTVSVHAYWLWMDDTELAALLQTDKEAKPNASKPFAHGSVNRDAWNKFLEQAAKEDKTQAGYRAVVTCYNGQTVHTLAGRQQLVATGLYPEWMGPKEIHKDQQALGDIVYNSETKLVQEGVALQITPLTNTSGKYVVLDLQSRLATLHQPKVNQVSLTKRNHFQHDAAAPDPKDVPAENDDPFGAPATAQSKSEQKIAAADPFKAAEKEAAKDAAQAKQEATERKQSVSPDIQKERSAATHKQTRRVAPSPQEVLSALPLPGMDISRLSTTLRVPVGEPYLVGGMSQAGLMSRQDKQLYLFVELFVQELRDDLEPALNLQGPKREAKGE